MSRFPLLSPVVALLLGSLLFASPLAAAQNLPQPVAGISVMGSGRASAPAETATIVLMLGAGYSYEEPQLMEPETSSTPPMTAEEMIAPVLKALVDAGVPEADIEILANPYAGGYGPDGSPMAVSLRFELQDPTVDGISALLDPAVVAARDAGLFINMAGVIYGVADCAALQREARTAAIADARDKATMQAELLEVTAGEVIASRDDLSTSMMYGGYTPINTCTLPSSDSPMASLYSAAPFDPGLPAEVTVVINVEITFGITDAEAAS